MVLRVSVYFSSLSLSDHHSPADTCRACVADDMVQDLIGALEESLTDVSQFLVRADAAKDRRHDSAGPTLLRSLREIWRGAGKDALRDIEEACERLPFPVPEGVSTPRSKTTQRNARGQGKGGGYHGGAGGGGARDYSYHSPGVPAQGYSTSYHSPGAPAQGYNTYVPHGQEFHYEQARGPPITYTVVQPPQRQAHAQPSSPAANHEDRCVHCQGEHLSQRCFQKFPNLRPPR